MHSDGTAKKQKDNKTAARLPLDHGGVASAFFLVLAVSSVSTTLL